MGDGNPKARLQEVAQLRLGALPSYALRERRGPDHASSFQVEARLADFRALGEGTSRKRAEQSAARALMEVLAAHDITIATSAPASDSPIEGSVGVGGSD